MKQSFLQSHITKVRFEPEYIAHNAILGFIDILVDQMEKGNVSKSELARRSGLATAQITRILRGNHNVTIATLGKIASALRFELGIVTSQKPGRKEKKQND